MEANVKGKGKRPIKKRSERPTLTGTPPLGYLNSCYCPVCKIHLFSYYDSDVLMDRKDGCRFSISDDWNYCSKCGTLLDLSEWKHEKTRKQMLESAIVVGAEKSIEFDD